jgi:hypothetical protein
MAQNSTDVFLGYWRALQTDAGQAPTRNTFDPAVLKPLVSQMLMIGSGRTQYRFRLSGGYLVNLHGHELKDVSLLSLFHVACHQGLRTSLMLALRQERPLILSAKGRTSRAEEFTLDILLAPLREKNGDVERMVGLYVPTSDMPHMTGQKVERFNLMQSQILSADEMPEERPFGAKDGPRLVSVEGRLIA